eukprot:gene14931-24627_t
MADASEPPAPSPRRGDGDTAPTHTTNDSSDAPAAPDIWGPESADVIAARDARRENARAELDWVTGEIIKQSLWVGYLCWVLPWPAMADQDSPLPPDRVDRRPYGICERDYSWASPSIQQQATRLLGRFLLTAAVCIRRAIGSALMGSNAKASEIDDF